MKIQIKNRWDEKVIFETDAETIGGAVAAAIASTADLYGANLRSANLRSADLRSADLHGADLSSANLTSANLSSANLYGANLRSADLCSADLRSVDLRSADLYGADLYGADLSGADLSGATNWEHILFIKTIVPEGDLIGWKKLSGGSICKLKIPAKAKRVGGLIGRKCRAEYAKVISGAGASSHDPEFKYVVGKVVRPASFDPDPRVECSGGIHFFITREEAEAY